MIAVVVFSTPSSTGPSSAAPADATTTAPPAEPSTQTAADEPASGPFDLSQKYVPGQSRRFIVFSRTNATLTTQTQEQPVRQQSDLYYLFTIKTVTHDDTGTTLRLTYDRIRTINLSSAFQMRTDTKTDAYSDSQNTAQAYKRAIGVPVTIVLDPDGRIESASHDPSDFDDTVTAYRLSLHLLGKDGILDTFGLLFAHTAEQQKIGFNEPWMFRSDYDGIVEHR